MSTTGSNDTPRRRRRWWVWLGMGLLLVPLVLLAAWAIWLGHATRQRDAAMASLRQAGLPTSFGELVADLQPVDDARNAATDYLAAAELIDREGPAWKALMEWPARESDVTEEDRTELRRLQAAVVAEQSAALERVAAVDGKIRPAVEAVEADFDVWRPLKAHLEAGGPAPDPISLALPNLTPMRDSARLLRADAEAALADGDATRARRQIIRIIGLADALDADSHALVENLSAIGTRAIAFQLVQSNAGALAADASKEQYAVLVRLLLEEGPAMAGYRRAIHGEAAFQMEVAAALDGAPISLNTLTGGDPLEELVSPHHQSSLLGFVARPILRDNQARGARLMLQRQASLDAPTWPAARAQIPTYDEIAGDAPFSTYLGIMLPSLERAAEAQYRSLADARLAAAALAVARYRSEHDGAWPESLEALVPNYLPAVPRDAMAEGDAPIRYDPARRILWSTGTDGIDDGGDPASTRRNGQRQTIWDGRDAVVEL